MSNPFQDRKLVVATLHGKELAIAPVLESQLGVQCEVMKIDTDQFGTFSGEIERILHPIEAARRKIQLAAAASHHQLFVANEGSFIPHPAIGFVSADEEILLLADLANGWEIAVKRLSTETNFSGELVRTERQLLGFAQKAGFPSHALILRESQNSLFQLHKGIQNRTELLRIFNLLQDANGHAWVETDMRAMLNPTRMKVIGEAAEKLALAALSNCPECNTPGFVVTGAEEGLPCEACGSPTHSIQAHILKCAACLHEERRTPPGNRRWADPQFCDYCNP